MNRKQLFARALLFFAIPIAAASTLTAQVSAAGTVEFVAQAKPTDGQLEPVRQLQFYLLRKSLTEIRAEAEKVEPLTDMVTFIDGLKSSPQLKAWMKAHHRVDLAGTDFTKQLTADDIVDIPEFFAAYKVQNDAALNVTVPEPKLKAKGKDSDHEKFRHQLEQYHEALKHYIQANPDSLEGLDADLSDDNPFRSWVQLQNEQQARIQSQALKLAETRYLAGRTNSDLDGRGVFTGVAPGEYWISTLDTPAITGDLRLRWDVSVMVRTGETARIELSNLNALDPPVSATR